MKTQTETVRVNLKLTDATHKQVKSKAALAGVTLQEWIETIVNKAANENGK